MLIASVLFACSVAILAFAVMRVATSAAEAYRLQFTSEARISLAELYVFIIRHVQHHAAQLILRLRLDADLDVPWIGAGWREL